MDAQATGEILRFFRGLNDPRAANARHSLSDILSIAILAVLCGSEGWAAVESWGWGNAPWLIEQKGHYLLAVKENQPTLHAKVKELLDEAILEKFAGMRHGFDEQRCETNNHGRIETRRVRVTNEVKWLGEELLEQWPGLASLIVVESVRQDLGDLSGKVSTERRYFISSHGGTDARFMAEGIRGHWGIENALHWSLDVQMNEDQCRLRVAHGAENFSRLRRISLNKLKRWEFKKPNGNPLKMGLRLKQQSCGWSREFLLQALLA